MASYFGTVGLIFEFGTQFIERCSGSRTLVWRGLASRDQIEGKYWATLQKRRARYGGAGEHGRIEKDDRDNVQWT